MASQIPAVSELKTWEDAFQHPLPVVRRLELQLRKNIDDNRQKLRSLVGASYRDLLGTAERIIEMDDQIQHVETHLSDIGRKCNTRAVERAVDNDQRLRKLKIDKNEGRLRIVAQTKVLQSTLAVVSRTIKSGGDALLAAKLLVLARLLNKSISESFEPPAVVEQLRRKLGVLRKKLLTYIERALVKPEPERATLADTLCAYALITSSAPKDVLRRFLQARYEQLEAKSELPSETTVLEMLDMHSHTLLDTKELFPRRFAEALSQLAHVPLLFDEQLRSVSELNLDIYEQWISDDVRTFTPWVRHDQLTATEATEGAAAWGKQARSCLLQALRQSLEGHTDAQDVLAMRQKVLSSYVALGSKLRDQSHLQSINDLYEVFLARLRVIFTQTAGNLDINLGSLDALSSSRTGPDHLSLWQLAASDAGLTHGAIGFRQSVLTARHGRNDVVRSVCRGLDSWVDKLTECWTVTHQMRVTKWDDVFDFDLDDFEELDDGDSLQTILAKRDPELLETELRQATSSAFQFAYQRVKSVSEDKQRAATLVRVVRELEQRRRRLGDRAGEIESTELRDELVQCLHQAVAKSVCEAPLQSFRSDAISRQRVATALWDGSPPLPIQPSPHAFRFLASLQRSMSDAGDDLWTHQTVQMLKLYLDEMLAVQFDVARTGVSKDEKPLTNGHGDDHDESHDGAVPMSGEVSNTDRMNRDAQTQQLFDILYLDRSFGARKQHNSLGRLATSVEAELDLDHASRERLRKSASEYWKRTYLLFGLLASDSA